jgi:hypothetical protein
MFYLIVETKLLYVHCAVYTVFKPWSQMYAWLGFKLTRCKSKFSELRIVLILLWIVFSFLSQEIKVIFVFLFSNVNVLALPEFFISGFRLSQIMVWRLCTLHNEHRAILFNTLENCVPTIELILVGNENLTPEQNIENVLCCLFHY